MRFLFKLLLTSLIVAGSSELARRWTLLAALIVSLPLSSILALSWLYADARDVEQAIAMSRGIPFMLIPSLLFFVVLPILLQRGMRFEPALGLSCIAMVAGYWLYVAAMRAAGVSL